MADKSQSDTPESLFISFIRDRLEKHGQLSLQSLTGHLSHLPARIRNNYGSSKATLKKFIKEHPEEFFLDKLENVDIMTPDKIAQQKQAPPLVTQTIKNELKPSPPKESSIIKETPSSVKTELKSVRGKVYRMFDYFGFITVVNPVSAAVYFDVQSFENGQHKTLTGNVTVGDILYLSAYPGPDGCEASHRASHVWRTEEGLLESTRTVTEFEGRGKIHNLFSTYGFISQSKNPRENVFFHLKTFSYDIDSLENVLNLKIGDRVSFTAKMSEQTDKPVKWQAIKCWLDKSDGSSCDSSIDNKTTDGNDDIYMSSPGSSMGSNCGELDDNLEDIQLEQQAYKMSIMNNFTNNDHNSYPLPPPLPKPIKPRILLNNPGLLSPKSPHIAIIVFGEQYTERAVAVSNVVYLNGAQVKNFIWDADQMIKVNFDALEDLNETAEHRWKTILAWTENKPNVKLPDPSTLMIMYDNATVKYSSNKIENTSSCGSSINGEDRTNSLSSLMAQRSMQRPNRHSPTFDKSMKSNFNYIPMNDMGPAIRNYQPFFHPAYQNMNPNENQHVLNLESKIKELSQQLEQLELEKESLIKTTAETSTQTLPALFNKVNYTKPETNSRTVQTTSTGSVMYSKLYHE